MKYLLDTCVISELVAKKPNQKVLNWIDSIDPDSAYLSVITIGEIKKGIEKLPDSQRRTTLHAWLTEDLLARFSGRILLIDTGVVLVWGQLAGSLESEGKKMGAIDSLIAASARYNHCSLVTRNEIDFVHTGIAIINPWMNLNKA
ncbi:MAG: type II toxin-antitoxin system VapC family toxin [Desulfomonilia bacterium]|jgi:tRNA(fMet)-specific endonuclease VapC|nr:type II toxin-antitoxin system VapC family toxin [Deltaproteobacteria bacterium]